jgi:hypothetical protein
MDAHVIHLCRLFHKASDKKLKPLKGVLMTLHQVKGRDTKCCDGLPIVRSKKTNWRGSVDFRGLSFGYYWLKPEGQDQWSAFGIEIGKYGQDQCNTKFVLNELGRPNVQVTISVD